MCCFRLHFSDFNVLFFQKNKKIWWKFAFEKNDFLCKKSEKNNLSQGKILLLPTDIDLRTVSNFGINTIHN